MEAVEEISTPRFARLHLGTGLRVEQLAHEIVALTRLAFRQPTHRQPRRSLVRQTDEPARRTGSMGLQVGLGQLHAGAGIEGACRNLRLHPLGDLVLEVRERPGQENREQQPAEQKTDPGVQPGHRLTEALFHDNHLPQAYAAPSTAQGANTPTQACSAVRQAKHQSTATR